MLFKRMFNSRCVLKFFFESFMDMMYKIPEPIRKILVPIDGSTNSMRGLDEAILYAKDLGANITGLFVEPIENSKQTPTEITSLMGKAERNAMLQGVTLRNEISKGDDAGQTIANFADNEKFDMVIIGARGVSKAREKILGSVSKHVVESTKVPVLIVK